jgi:hypothetical protein
MCAAIWDVPLVIFTQGLLIPQRFVHAAIHSLLLAPHLDHNVTRLLRRHSTSLDGKHDLILHVQATRHLAQWRQPEAVGYLLSMYNSRSLQYPGTHSYNSDLQVGAGKQTSDSDLIPRFLDRAFSNYKSLRACRGLNWDSIVFENPKKVQNHLISHTRRINGQIFPEPSRKTIGTCHFERLNDGELMRI